LKKIIIGYCIDTMPCRVCVFKWIVIHINIQIQAINRTCFITGKDKTQVQQKRYRYTNKERDDSSGLCYYGARYLAPWLARWISPDSAGAFAKDAGADVQSAVLLLCLVD
jgi:RHS repeat-associated protein